MTRLLVGAAVSAGMAIADVPDEGVTVAFTGDQGTDGNARDVLQLVADRGADLLLIQGDFGYDRRAAWQWIRNLEEMLGPDFPVLGVVGNHENYQWPVYRDWLAARIDAVDDLACEGTTGVKARCTFRGITVAQVAPGVHEVGGVAPDDDYAAYLERELANDPNRWRICSWHKNQRDMQIGGKGDESGWGVYDACRRVGGIVATGHAHSYSRTHLMSDFGERQVADRKEPLTIGPGRSFAFVSGLGGRGVREQRRDGHWWAAVYSATQGASHGALFCTFFETSADCRFEDVTGAVADRFTVENANVPGDGSPGAVLRSASRPGDAPTARSGAGAIGLLSLFAGLVGLGRGRAREPTNGATRHAIRPRHPPPVSVCNASSGGQWRRAVAIETPRPGDV